MNAFFIVARNIWMRWINYNVNDFLYLMSLKKKSVKCLYYILSRSLFMIKQIISMWKLMCIDILDK